METSRHHKSCRIRRIPDKGIKDGEAVFAKYKGVRVGIIKTNGNIATVFPDYKMQPKPRREK